MPIDNALELWIPRIEDEWLLDDFLASDPPARRWPVQSSDELFDEIVSTIVERFQPRSILLFGSRARDDNQNRSDIDILVSFDAIDNKRDLAVAIASTLSGIAVGKDVIVTTPGEIALELQFAGSLIENAMREGRVLYERGSSYAQDTGMVKVRAG